ncbi:MAG: hypothetical protein D6768_16765 [Chloroflexi bacterium]|nr:MAG: hypothetical protein D6768_16765 [Chloroflexota bacterium]
MAKRQNESSTQGTFAQLYEVQEELSRRGVKPLGRPPKKIRRKPTTVHLAQSEHRNLSKLHMLLNEQFSINRSELVGVAIDVLAEVVEIAGDKLSDEAITSLESFKRAIYDVIKS